MSSNLPATAFRVPVLGALTGLVLGLGGCGIFDNSEPPLEGERISLRDSESGLADQVIEAPVAEARSIGDWTQTNGNSAHNSGNIAGPAQLTRAWSVDAGTGTSSDSWITSPPIVSGGLVLVLDAEATVRAFDAQSGTLRWESDLAPEGEDGEEGFGGGLAADGGTVYAATGFGEVLALSQSDGEIRWRKGFDAPFRSAPAAGNGLVVAVTRDNRAFALSGQSGDVIWRHQGVASDTGLLGGASPAIAGGLVVVPYASGEMQGLDARSGRSAWNAILSGGRRGLARSSITDLTGGPVIAGPLVIAANQSGRMVAIEGRSGARVWTRAIGSLRPTWPVADTLFLMSDLNEMTRISVRNGQTLWRTQLPRFEDEEDLEDPITFSGPIVVAGRVLATNNLGEIWSFDAVNGKGEVVEEFSGGSRTGPIAANGTVYILTDGADLIAYR